MSRSSLNDRRKSRCLPLCFLLPSICHFTPLQKFGELLTSKALPEWEQYYLPYAALKKLLSALKKLAKLGEQELTSMEGLVTSTDASFCGRLDEVSTSRRRNSRSQTCVR